MTSLKFEEQKILDHLLNFYKNEDLKKIVKEAFNGGVTEQENGRGIIKSDNNKLIDMSFVNLDERNAAKQGKAIGFFVRGLKFTDYWQKLFVKTNKDTIESVMINLNLRSFNTELFLLVIEHYKASNIQEDFLKLSKKESKENPGLTFEQIYTNFMKQIESIEEIIRRVG